MTPPDTDPIRPDPVTISVTPPSQSSEVVESVHCTAHRDDDDAWSCFIDQLRSRGPMFSRYQFRGEIGRGGMGVVHRVFDVDARRELAMKVILEPKGQESQNGECVLDSRTLGRFLEEAQVTGQLDHPGIVPVHEIGVDPQNHVYFTMKLVKGEDLRTIFEKLRTGVDDWSIPRAIGVLIKVCEAMAFAHTKGVIHRDLKPSNVMVGRFGEAYVMDWGLARIVDDGDATRKGREIFDPDRTTIRSERNVMASTDSGSGLLTMDGDIVGTPSYMSPEQARGQRNAVGAAADIYSLGAMLYHLLAGHPPYRDTEEQLAGHEITSRVIVGPPRLLSDVAPHAPPELIAIQEKAMAREPHRRYATMADLAQDLRAWLENRVVAAYDHGVFARSRKWLRRNRAVASTMLAALALITVLTGFFFRSLVDREEKARVEAARADRNAKDAERNATDARRREREVAAAHANLLRLADAKRFETLVSEWNELWPATADTAPRMRAWIDRAKELVARRTDHERTLAAFRDRPGSAKANREAAPRKKDRAALDSIERADAVFAIEFGDDAESQWWHDTLKKLVEDLATLDGADVHRPTIAGMSTRLRFAESVQATTIDDRRDDWNEAAKRVATSPRYGGLALSPQLGLVPLGPDPDSDLEEFALLESGEVPLRERSTGRLAIGDSSAAVLVLIPGGAIELGAQITNPDAPRFDPTAKPADRDGPRVVLDPYFLGKHELTQAQWKRLIGENPSFYLPGAENLGVAVTEMNPVERIDYGSFAELVRRLGNGFAIPTGAQWEFAARGGVATRWPHGAETEGLDRFANLADGYCKSHGGPASWTYDEDLWDGYASHAPIGSFAANGFGLHDTVGNVWEWTREPEVDYRASRVVGGDGELLDDDAKPEFRVTRGGAFNEPSELASIVARMAQSMNERDTNLGARLARRLAN